MQAALLCSPQPRCGKTGLHNQRRDVQGRFVHIGPTSPSTQWDMSFDVPWWRDHARYRVGALTTRARRVRLCNVLTHGAAAQPEVVLEVPRPCLISCAAPRLRARVMLRSHGQPARPATGRCMRPH